MAKRTGRMWLGALSIAVGCVVLLASSSSGGRVFGCVLLAAGAYLVFSRRTAGTAPAAPRPARLQPGGTHATAAHTAPPPAGTPVEAWSTQTSPVEVVGEFYRDGAFADLFRLRADFDGVNGAELNASAALVADFGNPHDRHAVAVWVEGVHVGYLERALAAQWAATVDRLASGGQYLMVRARTWARRGPEGHVSARVTVWLPGLDGIHPANGFPMQPHVILPAGGPVQVTQEDRHMEALVRFARPEGVPVVATLHARTEVRPRSTVDTVEVQIDGHRIGVLSPTQTANLLPLVKFVVARGLLPVVKATVRGNALRAEVTLAVAKTQEVPDAWLAALGPESRSDSPAAPPEEPAGSS